MQKRSPGRAAHAVFLAVAGIVLMQNANAGTPVSWLNDSSGTWNVGSNWSGGGVPQNGQPAGNSYDVTIGALGNDYLVILPFNYNPSVNTLVLNSPNASVLGATGPSNLITAGTINVQSGTLQVAGIKNANLFLSNSGTITGVGSLDSVTCWTNFATHDSVTVYNTATLQNGSELSFDELHLGTNVTVGGNGKLIAAGANSRWYSNQSGTASLTIAPNITLEGRNTRTGILAPVINQGTILIDNFNEIGFNSLVNTGTIVVAGGSFEFASSALFNQTSQLIRSGGEITFTGTLDNTGHTLDLSTAMNGPVSLAGSVINAGTVVASNGAISVFDESSLGDGGATFQNLTLAADVVGGVVTLNNVTLADSTIFVNRLLQGQLAGAGTVSVQSGTTPDHAQLLVSDIGPNITVTTGGGSGAIQSTSALLPLTNNGTITSEVPDQTLRIDGTFTNNGAIRVSNHGLVVIPGSIANAGTITGTDGIIGLTGTLTPASLRSFQVANALVLVGGTLNGAAASLSVQQNGFRVGLMDGGVLSDISLAGEAGDVFTMMQTGASNNNIATLNNVSVQVPVDVRRLQVQATNLANDSTFTVEQNSNLTLHGTLLNTGTIVAMSGSSISVQSAPINLGAISLSSSALIVEAVGTISGSAFDNVHGDSNSAVRSYSSVANAGHEIIADTDWYLYGETMSGGTFNAINGRTLYCLGKLDSVTLKSPMIVPASSSPATILNALHLQDTDVTLCAASPSGRLQTSGDVLIDGTGQIRSIAGTTAFAGLSTIGTCTIGAGVTLHTDSAGFVLSGATSTSVLHLQGSLLADTGQSFIGPGLKQFDNQGTASVVNSASLTVSSVTTVTNFANHTLSGGNWTVGGGSTLTFPAASTITTNAANIKLDGAGSAFSAIDPISANLGSFKIDHGRTFTTVGSLSNSGTFVVGQNSTLKISGDLTNTGTLDVNSAMIVDYASASPSPRIGIEQQIRAARNGFGWDQPGITSSRARDAGLHINMLGVMEGSNFLSIYGPAATFGGLAVDNSSVLVKFTYFGDSNFNGVMDGGDYARIDFTFTQQSLLGDIGGWINGDFDYNGRVDGSDYALMDAAFLSQSGELNTAMAFLSGNDVGGDDLNTSAMQLVESHYELFGDSYRNVFLSVPEPTFSGVAASAAMCGLLRRRRSRRAS